MIDAGKIAAILLAAGRSERFGEPDKLIAELDGCPLVLHAARRIVELEPACRIAVCNSTQGAPARLLGELGFEIVANPNPERGLSQSLALGIAEAARGPAEAALICLADMPYVSLSHLQDLLERFDRKTAPVIASARDGIAMPPALFAQSMFDRLRQGQGDQGGRTVLATATLVEASAAELADVDLPEDLHRK